MIDPIVSSPEIAQFLSAYSAQVCSRALQLRRVVIDSLPDIIEQLDLPARMIGYCYGQKYSQLICTIIPSKKGLKLGFNRGVELPDPHLILRGTGKISRYVEIKSVDEVNSMPLQELLLNALGAYKLRAELTG